MPAFWHVFISDCVFFSFSLHCITCVFSPITFTKSQLNRLIVHFFTFPDCIFSCSHYGFHPRPTSQSRCYFTCRTRRVPSWPPGWVGGPGRRPSQSGPPSLSPWSGGAWSGGAAPIWRGQPTRSSQRSGKINKNILIFFLKNKLVLQQEKRSKLFFFQSCNQCRAKVSLPRHYCQLAFYWLFYFLCVFKSGKFVSPGIAWPCACTLSWRAPPPPRRWVGGGTRTRRSGKGQVGGGTWRKEEIKYYKLFAKQEQLKLPLLVLP